MRKNRQNHKKVYNVVVILVMTLIGLIFILPYVWMLLNSFKPLTEIAKGKTFWPKQWTMKNYHTVMTQAPIWKWLRNSVITSVSCTVIMLVTSSLAGFVFAKYSFKGKEFIFMFILATMMVPSQTTMIPSFLLVQGLGMYDSLLALIIPRMVGGFGIFLCRQFIMDIPDELVEAAHIDGANDMFIYSRVIVPLIRPALGALAIFTFLGQWKPTRIALAALLFGLFRALSNVYSGIGFLANLNISSSIYNMMPYVISLIVLAFTSKKSRAPKAEGIPYDKGQR